MFKKIIIRWSLKQLKKELPKLREENYAVLESWGIADITTNEHTAESMIIL